MTISMQELRDKLARGIPGKPTCPDHPPLGLHPPEHDCLKCAGLGWVISAQYGTYFPCKCTLRERATEQKTDWTDRR